MPDNFDIQFGDEVLKANIPLSVSPTLGVAGSTGGILVPEVIDGEIRMMVETRSPLWNILNKQPWDTDVFKWREQTALPNADFALELDVLPDRTRSVYVMKSSNLKSIYTGGEISGQMQDASRSLVNIVSREIRNAGLALVRKLELTIINGDEGTNPEEFDGLAQWITTVIHNDDSVAQDGSGTDQPLSLDSLNRLMDAPVGGAPTHLIMSLPMRRRLWSVLQPQVRFSGPIQDGAFTVPFYMATPIIEIRDSHAGALDTRVYAIDNDLITVPVLREPSYEEMAHTRDSLDFIIKMYLGLVVEGVARHHAVLADVTSAIS